MTHSYETNTSGAGSVRIFRTPFCRVPPSLASIVSANTPKNATPPPVILPKKIMRRGEDGNGSTAPPSADASKATSEAGSDKDRPIAKERLTREEREEAYNRARERIFGTIDKTGESTPGIVIYFSCSHHNFMLADSIDRKWRQYWDITGQFGVHQGQGHDKTKTKAAWR